jgi:multisubunit Na+/H+ antiporter MnhB subunit
VEAAVSGEAVAVAAGAAGWAVWALDGAVALLLVGLAWRCLGTRNLLEAVVLFIALGLTLALAWVRLGAPDIALAEAALGAGITGALLLNALRRLAVKSAAGAAGAADPAAPEGDGGVGKRAGQAWRRAAGAVMAAGAAVLAAWLAWLLLGLPARAVDLPAEVAGALERSGVENPVTAVLLNFRAYDTLLEVAVLLVVAAALWALDPRETVAGASDRAGLELRAPSPATERAAGDPMLGALVRLVSPLVVVTAAYLAWAGGRPPGGAFQAGALLGGGAVLLLMAGRMRLVLPPPLWLRAGIVSGLAVFVAVGVATLAAGAGFLEYPEALAYPLILAVEAVLTVSIAVVLIALFAEVPTLGRATEEPELATPREEP